MSLIEELENLSDKIKGYSGQNLSESDTETFCFEPFIELLGFERSPVDMQKGYSADQRGGAKKVDYAIKKDDVPIMIVECKPLGDNLDAHTGQLGEYFSAVRKTRFGILTDGRLYRFYTDLDDRNLMDSEPFLEVDLFDIQPSNVSALEQFTKPRFNLKQALATVRDLKYSKSIQQFLMGQVESPTEDFVNCVASAVNIAINTPERRQQITEIVQRTLNELTSRKNDLLPLPPAPVPLPLPAPVPIDWTTDWTGKGIRGFTFNGAEYEVANWSEYITLFCKILSQNYADQFEGILQVIRPNLLSKNPDDDFAKGKRPKKIGETDIYVETNTNNIVRKQLVEDLVKHFRCNTLPVPHIKA